MKRLATACGLAALMLASRAVAADNSNVDLLCSQVMGIDHSNPQLGKLLIDTVVIQGMHVFDEHHTLGENVHVDFGVMKPADEVGFFRAWCTANPDEHISRGLRALYQHMADLTVPGSGGGPMPPPPPPGAPPGPPLGAVFAQYGSAALNAAAVRGLHEPLDALVRDVEHLHPIAMIFLSKRLFEAGRADEALFWQAEGQLRWSAIAKRSGDEFENDEMQRESFVSPDVDVYSRDHPDRTLAAIDRALDWDAKHPDDFTAAGQAKDDARKGMLSRKAAILAYEDELKQKAEEELRLRAAASTDDPYPGSGGAMFGTPQEMVSAYDPAKFTAFKIGVTTKKDVVAALGKPELWFTDKDGNSTLNYPYYKGGAGLSIIGMVQRVSVGFKFDAKKVLTEIDLPKGG